MVLYFEKFINLPVIAPISKTFKLHPAIIYSIIREQAGDPVDILPPLNRWL